MCTAKSGRWTGGWKGWLVLLWFPVELLDQLLLYKWKPGVMLPSIRYPTHKRFGVVPAKLTLLVVPS